MWVQVCSTWSINSKSTKAVTRSNFVAYECKIANKINFLMSIVFASLEKSEDNISFESSEYLTWRSSQALVVYNLANCSSDNDEVSLISEIVWSLAMN